MGEIKQINIKIKLIISTMIKLIEKILMQLLKTDKKDCNGIDIYYIGYVNVKRIPNCNNINSV